MTLLLRLVRLQQQISLGQIFEEAAAERAARPLAHEDRLVVGAIADATGLAALDARRNVRAAC